MSTSRSVFHKYEKYWKNKKIDKNKSPLDWFDIKCLAQSLLSDEERKEMGESVICEEFIEILVEATKTLDFEVLLDTMRKHKINLNYYSMEGYTPLQTVVKIGNNEIVRILLQNNADPNKCDLRHGYSPLQLAAINDHADCIITLLQHDAKLTYVNKMLNNRNALHYACENGHLKCISALITPDYELNPVKKRDLLKEIFILLNAQDSYGLTPLHLAVIDGKAECVKLLIKVSDDYSSYESTFSIVCKD